MAEEEALLEVAPHRQSRHGDFVEPNFSYRRVTEQWQTWNKIAGRA